MVTMWTQKRAILAGLVATAIWAVPSFAGQKPEVVQHFQAGEYQEAVEAAQDADPASTYLAAQAYLKLEQADQANAAFGRMRDAGRVWSLIGESGSALVANDAARGVALARQATEAGANNAWAFYQLGLAASKAGDYAAATTAFTKSIELNSDFAYAHYYAALAYQRQRQLAKSAERFESFLRLAPNAPEKQAVQAIMRTLK